MRVDQCSCTRVLHCSVTVAGVWRRCLLLNISAVRTIDPPHGQVHLAHDNLPLLNSVVLHLRVGHDVLAACEPLDDALHLFLHHVEGRGVTAHLQASGHRRGTHSRSLSLLTCGVPRETGVMVLL
eukprot:8025095-Pyramimonas_sp.AAC.1